VTGVLTCALPIWALWLTRDELAGQPQRWRSELVLRCVDDYLSGPLHDLAVVRD